MSVTPSGTATAREVDDRESFAFVMNVSRFTEFETLELAPGHHIRRANKEEIDEIRKMIESLGRIQPFSGGAWESCWSADGSQKEKLEPERWRYFVIAFRGNNLTFHKLSNACILSSAEPDVGPMWFKSKMEGMGWHSERLIQSMDDAAFSRDYFIDLCKKDVEEIIEIHGRLSEHNHTIVDLDQVVNQLKDLKALPRKSDLRFLGYFAVLESLLTHLPKPSDPYDSITRQVKKKLVLLNSRFPESIDYASFGDANADTIWSKMYQYRSQIAHGASPTFTGELQILQSPEQARALVIATTKAVARQALREPRLIADLRDC